MTLDQYRSYLATGNLVGVTLHINSQPVTIHDQSMGYCFYMADGHEFSMRDESTDYLVTQELAMMLWPELKLWEKLP